MWQPDIFCAKAYTYFMAKNSDYTDVLLEEIRGDIKAILEVVVPMKEQVDHIPHIEQDIVVMKDDIEVIKK